jgi:hypothetical protein
MRSLVSIAAALLGTVALLNPSTARALVISELMPANTSTVADEDGDFSDWLEIHNDGATAANLDGYRLTDNDQLLTKWTLPAVSVPAGGYLLVWASDKNRTNTSAPLHTNFRLSADGEYLALVAPDGTTVIHEYAPSYPGQVPDRSYGLASDLVTERCFVEPTPGAANDETAACSLIAEVSFSVERGFYDAPFQTTLSTATLGATIHYTLDGSEPSPSHGIAYIAPIDVQTTTTLRAMAFANGMVPTPSITHTYVFLDDVLQQSIADQPPEYLYDVADYDMDPRVVDDPRYAGTIIEDLKSIPTLSVVTDVDHLFGPQNGIYTHRTGRGEEWERPTSVELFSADGESNLQINCGIRMQGGVSRLSNIGKYSFRLLFKSLYGPSKLVYPFFPGSPVNEFDTITLTAFHNKSWAAGSEQAQYIRDTWLKDTQRAMGQLGSHVTYVHLYLNGRYWGLYRPTERPSAPFLAAHLGGEREDYDVLNSGKLLEGDRVAWDTMQALARAGVTTPAQYAALLEYVDVDNLIDYMMSNIFAGNYDWPYHNWYAGRRREPGAGWMFFNWDGEATLENVNGNRVSAAVYETPAVIYDRLRRGNEEFRVLFGDHVYRHFFNGGALTPEANVERWMKRAAEIRGAVVGESARWGDRARFFPYTRDNEYIVEQRRLVLAYFPARTRIVLQQFRDNDLYPIVDAPTLSQHGGDFSPGLALEMTAPDGIVYYSYDGSDPRLPGGAVSPSAEAYTSSIPLVANTSIKARAQVGIEWSALVEADFVVASPLRVTELMYHPPAGDDYEYLEIRNTGTTPIDLAGMSLSDGVDFTFPSMLVPAGGHVLVVENTAQFTAYYGAGLPVAGQYSGKFDNAGERLALRDADGGVIQEFEYGDAWHPASDGAGRSLVIRDALAAKNDWNDADGWRASAVADGTPGSIETALCANGLDDDGDGLTDLADAGCGIASHDREDPECDDGVDNDGDGLVDAADLHCASAAGETELPDRGDSFLCYRTHANNAAPAFAASNVTLSDEFESDVDFAARTPRVLCLAGSLNSDGVFDGDTHLQGYEIREMPGEPLHAPRPELSYRGGLAPLYLGTTRPDRLLVPTAIDLGGPTSAPGEFSHGVDHYKCYRTVLPETRPRYLPSKATVRFEDMLEQRDYSLKPPKHLCAPVSADGSFIKTPGRHLLCFPAKREKFSNTHVPVLGIHTANGLATDVVDTSREEELCVPSALVIP